LRFVQGSRVFVIPPPDNELMATNTDVRSRVQEVTATALAALPDERLEAELCQLAADLAAGTARWFRLIAEYDRRQVWQSWECRSMAAWLAGHVGVAKVTARQYVQVARTLEQYPLLSAEFDAGRLSYSRVRAVCRVITPTSEADLVSMALNATAPQLERFVRSVERVTKQAEPDGDRSQHERREFAIIADDDGTWIVRGRLPAEVGTALRRALDADMKRERDRRFAEVPAGPAHNLQPLGPCCDTFLQLNADALERVFTAGHNALEQPATSHNPGDGEAVQSEAQQSDAAASPRRLVVIHRYPDGDELEGGPALSTAHADRLALNADTITAAHHQTVRASAQISAADDIIDERITYSRIQISQPRVPNRSQRRALTHRDQACRFPGCDHRGSLHAHHIHEYSKGGATKTINLVLLCSMHHHAVHRNGWTITGTVTGQLQFNRPGLTTSANSTRSHAGDLDAVIDRFTGPITPAMRGEPFDLNLAVMAFLHNESLSRQQRSESV
jgi:5-methylcytosine-specific restriction endonuclease McrA